MPVLIGTSGWQYAHWKQRFYPPGLPTARWLEHYAERFRTVEVNNAFYRLPEKTTFENWKNRTPRDFEVSVKASRYITHIKRLRDPAEPTRRLLERTSGLGTKLGPILLQFPPNLRADADALDELLAQFPKGVRVTVEPRHDSWYSDDIASLLEHHGAAFCLTDSPERKTPYWRTAEWGYLRMHAGKASPHPCYGDAALATWARRLAELWPVSATVYVYFNNDERACALRDANRFAAAAARAGLRPTRVPSLREISVDKTSA
jgi:uncharacterized protein YecE (DUF72 family)